MRVKNKRFQSHYVRIYSERQEWGNALNCPFEAGYPTGNGQQHPDDGWVPAPSCNI